MKKIERLLSQSILEGEILFKIIKCLPADTTSPENTSYFSISSYLVEYISEKETEFNNIMKRFQKKYV